MRPADKDWIVDIRHVFLEHTPLERPGKLLEIGLPYTRQETKPALSRIENMAEPICVSDAGLTRGHAHMRARRRTFR